MRDELRRYFVLAYFALAMTLPAWFRWRRARARRRALAHMEPQPWP